MASLILALLPWTAFAEIHVRDSLEWQAARADVVVSGRVQAVSRSSPIHEEAGGIFVMEDVRLSPREFLKGKASRKELDFRWKTPNGPRYSVGQWKESGHEVLFFLTEAEDGTLTLLSIDDAVDLTAGTSVFWPVVSQDQRVLKDGAQILEAVRRQTKALKGSHRKLRRATIEVPLDSEAGRALFSGSSVRLNVPR